MKINYPTTTKDGKTVLVSRIMWEKHFGKIPKGFMIHHKDGDLSNNRIKNLSCLSPSKHVLLHSAKKKRKKRKK